MGAGKYDTRVTFLERVDVRNEDYGTDEAQWLPALPAWAEVQDMLPSRAERLAEGVDIQRRPCRVRIPYRREVTAEMRLTIRGRTGEYRIFSGPVETGGRRRELEMLVEQLSSEGQRP